MDWKTILSGLVFFGLPVLGVAMAYYLQGRARQRSLEDFQAIARSHGLKATKQSCSGWVGDTLLEVAAMQFQIQQRHRYGPWKHQVHPDAYETRFVVTARPLLAIDIDFVWQSRRPFHSGVGQRTALMPPLHTETWARDAHRAHPLWSDQEARRWFEWLRHNAFRVEVTGGAVLVEWRQPMHRQHIAKLANGCLRLSERLNRIAAALPPSVVSAPLVPIWRKFAQAHGLTLRTTPLSVRGRLNGVRIVAFATLVGISIKTMLRVAFTQPLQLGLELTPLSANRLSRALLGDIRTGDDLFDPIFLLRAQQPELVRPLFPRSVRRRVRSLHERHPLRIDDRGICLTVEHASHPTLALEVLQEATRLLRAIEERAPAMTPALASARSAQPSD